MHSDTVQRIFGGWGGLFLFLQCWLYIVCCVSNFLNSGETWQAQHLEPVNTSQHRPAIPYNQWTQPRPFTKHYMEKHGEKGGVVSAPSESRNLEWELSWFCRTTLLVDFYVKYLFICLCYKKCICDRTWEKGPLRALLQNRLILVFNSSVDLKQ